MSLLDGILGQVLGGANVATDKQNTDIVAGMLQMLGNSPQSGMGGQGGIGGLVQQFEKAGLGHLVNSWVGTGQNLPATPQQVEQGLGMANLMALAQKLGITPQMLAAQLAPLLPVLIDKLSPKGQLPQQSQLDQAISGLGGLGGLAGALGGLLGSDPRR